MKHRKRLAAVLLLVLMAVFFAVPMASAASYSKVYGRTEDRLRVRETASATSAVIDNIVKDGCVYVTSSKSVNGSTYVQIKYRANDGTIETGWVCQFDGKTTYVKILSATDAASKFSVSSGDLPTKPIGTFTAAQRKNAVGSADTTYLSGGASGSTVKSIQTKLKALGYYSGSVTGNIGAKTEAAIRSFQSKNGLNVDGIAGPQTIAKIDEVYAASGKTSASASASTTTTTVSGSGLKLGSTGAQVKALQHNLATLGYYWAEETGNFGSKTETAVKRFQEENGLTADGVAGSKTLSAIAAAVAKKGGSSASSSTSKNSSVLKLNSTGTAVSTLQQNLQALGYYTAEITGNFGTKTEAAVKLFQSKNGLEPDGVAGKKTLDLIASKVKSGSSSSSSSSATGLKLGSTGANVTALQENLVALGYYYGDVTGHFGSMTETAVKKFQKAKGIPQDGVVGASTQNAITAALKSGNITPSTSGSSSSAASTGSSLKLGSSGSAVKELQTMLQKLDYYYGDITGSFGTLTQKAVRAFQDANGLTVDGVAGVSTINKLRALTGSTGSSSSSSSSAISYGDGYYKVSKNNVYLRASYSTSSASKASLSINTPAKASKSVSSGGYTWFYVTVVENGYTHKGYVRSDMLTKINSGEYNTLIGAHAGRDEDDDIICMIRVSSSGVALREGPGTKYGKANTANAGDLFYVVDSEPGWYKTREGYWISSDYVKVLSESEASSSASSSSTASSSSYRVGDTGSTVGWIQTALKSMGYYEGSVTNHYGTKTAEAVRQFQKDHGLGADGIAGAKTLAAIENQLSGGVSGPSTATPAISSNVYQVDWFSAKSSGRFPELGFVSGKLATLTDLTTNRSLTIRVQSAGNHLDVEPATATDTKTLCTIYGASSPSGITYVRRPMLLTTANGQQIVCSIYGVPHGQQVITNNNFNGQFCLHFTNSRTSGTNKVDADHQNAIARAIAKIQSSWGVTVKTIK